MPVHWLNVGTGECIDNDDNPRKTANHVYAHGPAPTLTTLAVCKAACEQGQSICAGINWLPDGGGYGPARRCQIQTKKGPTKAEVEKAIGTSLEGWWEATDPSLPIKGAWNHHNADWTAKATCWALKSGEGDQPGLGAAWPLIIFLMVGGIASYFVLGALHIRLTTTPSQRAATWPLLPHRAFWLSLLGLFMDGAEFTRYGMRGMKQSGGGGDTGSEMRRGSAASEASHRSSRSRKSKSKGGSKKISASGSKAGKAVKAGSAREPLISNAPPQPARDGTQPARAETGNPTSTTSGGGGRWVRAPA